MLLWHFHCINLSIMQDKMLLKPQSQNTKNFNHFTLYLNIVHFLAIYGKKRERTYVIRDDCFQTNFQYCCSFIVVTIIEYCNCMLKLLHNEITHESSWIRLINRLSRSVGLAD